MKCVGCLARKYCADYENWEPQDNCYAILVSIIENRDTPKSMVKDMCASHRKEYDSAASVFRLAQVGKLS